MSLGAALWTAEGEPVQSVPVGESGLWAQNERLRRERDAALARVAELTRTVDLPGRVIVHAAGHDRAVAS